MKLSINIVANLITICPTIAYDKPYNPARIFGHPEVVCGEESRNPGNLTCGTDQEPAGARPLRQVMVDPKIGKLQAVAIHAQWLKTVACLPGAHDQRKVKAIRIQPDLEGILRPR